MKEEKTRCNATVYSGGFFRGHRCCRYEWKDGYCKQHHPETQKARNDATRKKYEEEANAKIAILERQKRIIEAKKRIIEATKNIVLNTTLPPPEHEGFVFTLEEDFMELMNAYREYESIE